MKKLFLCLLCICCLVACKGEKVEKETIVCNDFWQAMVVAVEDKLNENSYYKDKWEINVEDESRAKDPMHRSITIRQVYKSDKQKITVMFSLQNRDQQTLSYVYKVEQNQNTYLLELQSFDEMYRKYQMAYLENNNEKAKGKLIVENQRISGDNLPLLKEGIEAWDKLLNDYQKEFDFDYHQYDFINVPKLAKNSHIPSMINDDVYTTVKYYSDVFTNAKGFCLQAFLEVQKDLSSVQFGIYNQDRATNDESNMLSLEKRTDNLYNMNTQKDLDVLYAVYFKDNQAYIYHQDKNDLEIISDVTENQGKQAIYILTKE